MYNRGLSHATGQALEEECMRKRAQEDEEEEDEE
jgi:hypothetical protein